MPAASVAVWSCSALVSKGCSKTAWIRSWAPVCFFVVPVICTSGWYRWMCISMLDVVLFAYPTMVGQCYRCPCLIHSFLRCCCSWHGTQRWIYQLRSFIFTLHSVTDWHANQLVVPTLEILLMVYGKKFALVPHYIHLPAYRVFCCVHWITTSVKWWFGASAQKITAWVYTVYIQYIVYSPYSYHTCSCLFCIYYH